MKTSRSLALLVLLAGFGGLAFYIITFDHGRQKSYQLMEYSPADLNQAIKTMRRTYFRILLNEEVEGKLLALRDIELTPAMNTVAIDFRVSYSGPVAPDNWLYGHYQLVNSIGDIIWESKKQAENFKSPWQTTKNSFLGGERVFRIGSFNVPMPDKYTLLLKVREDFQSLWKTNVFVEITQNSREPDKYMIIFLVGLLGVGVVAGLLTKPR